MCLQNLLHRIGQQVRKVVARHSPMKWPVLTFQVVVAAWTTAAVAGNYYVSSTGSNSNPGTDTAHAWATLTHVSTRSFQGGDTIFLRGGTYVDSLWIHGWHGTCGAPIVISSFGAETAIIRSPQTLPWIGDCCLSGLVRVRACTFLEIRKLRIVSPYGFGILVTDTSSHITISGNTIDSCRSSAVSWKPVRSDNCQWVDTSRQSHAKILDNTIHYCNLRAYSEEGISLRWVDTFEIARNTMIKDKQEGIAITRGSAGSIHHNKVIDPYPNYDTINSQRVWSDTLNIRIGIYVATCDSLFGTRNIDIYNNNVTGATSGISINTEDNASIDSIRVYNNVISGTNSGINTSHCYSSRGQKRHITIAHNTIRSKYSDLRIADTIQLVNDWKIYNNLLAGFNSYGINIKRVAKGVFHNAYDSSGIVIRNNAYANIIPNGVPPVQNGTDSVLVGQSFVTGGLGLVDTTTGDTVDFHITSSSAARDAGTSAITWPFDYDSLSRPVNDSVDIGAYEFRSWK